MEHGLELNLTLNLEPGPLECAAQLGWRFQVRNAPADLR